MPRFAAFLPTGGAISNLAMSPRVRPETASKMLGAVQDLAQQIDGHLLVDDTVELVFYLLAPGEGVVSVTLRGTVFVVSVNPVTVEDVYAASFPYAKVFNEKCHAIIRLNLDDDTEGEPGDGSSYESEYDQ